MPEWPKVVVPFLPAQGMALFPFILLKNKALKHHAVLLHHEKIHLRQQLELGIILFYLWYAAEYVYHRLSAKNHRQAYLSISFEKEAFANESESDYLNRRPYAAFLRFLCSGPLRKN